MQKPEPQKEVPAFWESALFFRPCEHKPADMLAGPHQKYKFTIVI